MLSKNEIKDIQSLSHKKFRDEMGLFLAEGPKIVEEIIKTFPSKIQKIYALPEFSEAFQSTQQLVIIDALQLNRISQLQTPNGVLALVRKFDVQIPGKDLFTIYLDTIQDPGNLGTIIRIADWFGVQQIVCSPGCADVYNPKVVQSTMGSIGRVNIYYDESDNWLEGQEQKMYAASLDGKPIQEMKMAADGILLIGNESKGIRPRNMERAGHKIHIPRKGRAESLNAAVATGIILSHQFS